MFKFPPKYKVMPYGRLEIYRRFNCFGKLHDCDDYKGYTLHKRFLLFFYSLAYFDHGIWGYQIAFHRDEKRMQELCDDYNSGRKK